MNTTEHKETPAPTSNTMMTTREAAKALNLKPKTLANWRSQHNTAGLGAGPAFVRVGTKTIRYRKSDIEAYIQSHCYTPKENGALGNHEMSAT